MIPEEFSYFYFFKMTISHEDNTSIRYINLFLFLLPVKQDTEFLIDESC